MKYKDHKVVHGGNKTTPDDIIYAVSSRPAYEQEIKDKLVNYSHRLKPDLRNRLHAVEIGFGPGLDGEPGDEELAIKYIFKRNYLCELEKEDIINKFRIYKISFKGGNLDEPPYKSIAAKISFVPSRLLNYFTNERLRKKPKFHCEGGSCFIYFGKSKKQRIRISEEKTNQCILLESLFLAPNSEWSVKSIYEKMFFGKRRKSTTSYSTNSAAERKRLERPIRVAIKEIQVKLKKNGLKNKLGFGFAPHGPSDSTLY